MYDRALCNVRRCTHVEHGKRHSLIARSERRHTQTQHTTTYTWQTSAWAAAKEKNANEITLAAVHRFRVFHSLFCLMIIIIIIISFVFIPLLHRWFRSFLARRDILHGERICEALSLVIMWMRYGSGGGGGIATGTRTLQLAEIFRYYLFFIFFIRCTPLPLSIASMQIPYFIQNPRAIYRKRRRDGNYLTTHTHSARELILQH